MAHLKLITGFADLLPQQKFTLQYFSSTDSAHKSSLSFKDTQLRLQSWELPLLQIWLEEPEDQKAEIGQAVRTKNIEPNSFNVHLQFQPIPSKMSFSQKKTNDEIITCHPRICPHQTPLWSHFIVTHIFGCSLRMKWFWRQKTNTRTNWRNYSHDRKGGGSSGSFKPKTICWL